MSNASSFRGPNNLGFFRSFSWLFGPFLEIFGNKRLLKIATLIGLPSLFPFPINKDQTSNGAILGSFENIHHMIQITGGNHGATTAHHISFILADHFMSMYDHGPATSIIVYALFQSMKNQTPVPFSPVLFAGKEKAGRRGIGSGLIGKILGPFG